VLEEVLEPVDELALLDELELPEAAEVVVVEPELVDGVVLVDEAAAVVVVVAGAVLVAGAAEPAGWLVTNCSSADSRALYSFPPPLELPELAWGWPPSPSLSFFWMAALVTLSKDERLTVGAVLPETAFVDITFSLFEMTRRR
jgi:hypothetical protein